MFHNRNTRAAPVRGCGLKIVMAALAAVWPLMPPEVRAAEVSIENDTGRIICELRFSSPDGLGWRDNTLPEPCLSPATVRNAPVPETGRPNLLAVFEDGDYLVYHGLEFGKYRHLRLGTDEAELFEWNPAADKPKSAN